MEYFFCFIGAEWNGHQVMASVDAWIDLHIDIVSVYPRIAELCKKPSEQAYWDSHRNIFC